MKQNLEYAGNLIEEMEEAEKLVPDGDGIELHGTTTATCNTFLTIYCC